MKKFEVYRYPDDNGEEGRADYDVNEYVYKIAKNKES